MVLQPSLQRFVVQEVQQNNEERYAEGRAKAVEMQRTAKTYREAVDGGLIDRHANPFFVAGVQEQYGAAMAGKFDDDLKVHLQHLEELREETDPTTLDKHVAEFRGKWEKANLGTGTKDKHFQGAYTFAAQHHVDSIRSAFVEGIGAKLETRSISTHFQRVVKGIKADVGRLPVEQIAAGINALNADLLTLGFSPTQVHKTTLRAIGETAEDLESKDVALLFDLVTGKDGAPLGDASPEFSKYARETIRNVLSSRLARERAERDELRMSQEATLDTVAAEATSFLLDNPNGDLRPFVNRVKHIRGASDEILRLRSTAADATTYDDQGFIDELYRDVWVNGMSERELLRKFKPNGGLTLKSLSWLHSQVRARDGEARAEARAAAADARDAARLRLEARREYTELVSDPLFRQYLGNVAGAFVGPDGILKGTVRDRANKAEADVTSAWIQWRRTQPANLDPAAVNDWLAKNVPPIIDANRRGLVGYTPEGRPLMDGRGTGQTPKPPTPATPVEKHPTSRG
jgi:hypothetical protein